MREITYVDAINEAINEEMARDNKIFLIGEDVSVGYRGGGIFGASKGLKDKYGTDRVVDSPISESAMAGCGVGAALVGYRPIVEIMFCDFATIALDQIVNCAAKFRWFLNGHTDIPIVYRMAYGAGIGSGSNHSQSLEAWYAHIPGLKVVMPSTPADAKGLLKSSIRDNNPVIFMEHKYLYRRSRGVVPDEEYVIPIGKGEIKKEGEDITLIATGAMVDRAINAAFSMEKDGISVEVLDPRTILPLDEDIILESVKKTGKVVIVHEATTFAGIGGEIAALVADKGIDYLDGPIKRVGGEFCPIPYSAIMEQFYLPGEEKIKQAIEKVVNV
jgi:pyruvate/2-oxoglutarate/acetoin dehydrogenase E1 component